MKWYLISHRSGVAYIVIEYSSHAPGQLCRYSFPFFITYLLGNLYLFINFCVCIKACTHATIYMWKSEDSLWELVPCFHYVGPRDRTQDIRLCSKHRVTSLGLFFLLLLLLPPTDVVFLSVGVLLQSPPSTTISVGCLQSCQL